MGKERSTESAAAHDRDYLQLQSCTSALLEHGGWHMDVVAVSWASGGLDAARGTAGDFDVRSSNHFWKV